MTPVDRYGAIVAAQRVTRSIATTALVIMAAAAVVGCSSELADPASNDETSDFTDTTPETSASPYDNYVVLAERAGATFIDPVEADQLAAELCSGSGPDGNWSDTDMLVAMAYCPEVASADGG